MTTYDGEEFFVAQLESILHQSVSNFELLIGDDCSGDSTREILEEYARKDSRIKLFFHPRRLGYLRNFEFLLKEAGAEYIALSDQDDLWHPEKLHRQIEAMRASERKGAASVLVHSDLSLIDEEGKALAASYFRKKGYRFPKERSVARMISRCGIMGNTILLNRTLLQKALPFPEGLVYHDYWLGVVAETLGRRVTIEDPLVEYRIHRSNSSARSRWYAGEFRYPWRHRWLPWRDTGRKEAIKELLERGEISLEDRRVIETYLRYLEAKGEWRKHYQNLAQQGFFDGVKESWRMRWRFAMATWLQKV